jgi:hypothetical protein
MPRHRLRVQQRVVIIETGLLSRINTMARQYLHQGHRRSSRVPLRQLRLLRQCRQGQYYLPHDTQDKILQRTEITVVEIRIMAEITASKSVRGHGRIQRRLQQPLHEVGDKGLQLRKHHIKTLAQEIVSSNQRLCHKAGLTLMQSVTPHHHP